MGPFSVHSVLLTCVPVNSKTAHPPPPPGQTPGAFDFFEKFWSNSPLCWQFRRSNAPPVRASKRVKSPTLQGKQNRLPLEINRIAYIWKQVYLFIYLFIYLLQFLAYNI